MKTEERAFWDSVARSNAANRFLVPAFAKYKGAELKSLVGAWIGETGGLKVLKTDLFEEASGHDQLLFDMFKQDKVFGVDISGFVVERAYNRSKEFGDNYNFITGDVRALPYEDKTFDLIISNSTLDHLPRPEIGKAVLELKRVLKDGGRLLLTIDNKENLPARLVAGIGVFSGIISFPIEFYSRKEMEGLFARCGLKIEKSTAIIHLPSASNKALHALSRVLPEAAINSLAAPLVGLAKTLGRRRTRFLTGWLLAFLLSKE